MVDEIIATRIDNPTSYLDSFSSSSNAPSVKDGIANRVIDVVKKLIEFNGLDR